MHALQDQVSDARGEEHLHLQNLQETISALRAQVDAANQCNSGLQAKLAFQEQTMHALHANIEVSDMSMGQ
jgi:hypothetical protein